MKKPIIIDRKRFSRVKKLLKKNLEKQNINISLSESGEIISKSLGFVDYNHLEKMNFNDVLSVNNSSSLYNTKKIYLEYIYSVLQYIQKDLFERKKNIIKNPQDIEIFYHLFHTGRNLLSIIKNNKELIINNAFPIDYYEESRFFIKSRTFYSAHSNNAHSSFYKLSDDLHNIMGYYFLKDRENYYLQPEEFYKETPKIILTNSSLEDGVYQFLKEMNIPYPFYKKVIQSTIGSVGEGKISVIADILKNTNNQKSFLSYDKVVEFNYKELNNVNFFIYNKNSSDFDSGMNFKNNKDIILWLCDKSNKDYIIKNDVIIYKSQNNGYEIFLFDDVFLNAIISNDKDLIMKEFFKNKFIIKEFFIS